LIIAALASIDGPQGGKAARECQRKGIDASRQSAYQNHSRITVQARQYQVKSIFMQTPSYNAMSFNEIPSTQSKHRSHTRCCLWHIKIQRAEEHQGFMPLVCIMSYPKYPDVKTKDVIYLRIEEARLLRRSAFWALASWTRLARMAAYSFYFMS
jgi:hypothetical protein